MIIQKNIGPADRVARLLIGLALIAITAFAIVGPRNPLAYLGLVGIIPVAAGIVGYCPPYAWLGINTSKKHAHAPNHERGHQCV